VTFSLLASDCRDTIGGLPHLRQLTPNLPAIR